MSEALWRVAVNAPLREALTYKSDLDLSRGLLVDVPLGRRSVKGVVLGRATETPEFTLKSVIEIDLSYPPMPDHFVSWLEWLGQYYIHPPGMVMQSAYPPLAKSNKNRKSTRPPVVPTFDLEAPLVMTAEQEETFKSIAQVKNYSTHLVFGVTGSGKTEVYLRLLDRVLSEGKTGLVLVPEISLTPQLINRFAKRFGDKIAAIHSQLTERERTTQWWDIVEGRKTILIGARSALFCPIPHLGLIIVDEEHEPSYKQEEKLKYNGRDAAIVLAKLSDCPIVLGSATPSLETWKNAVDGKYKLHTLKNRVANRSMPIIEVIDLRQNKNDEQIQKLVTYKYAHIPFWMSPQLYDKIQETITEGYQIALFLNRRGIAQMILCPACGYTCACPNCDINLTLHGKSHLVCHYCDYHENLKKKCPDCKEGELEAIGLGTEMIENDLIKLFPDKRIARADRDEIQNRADLESLIEDMENGAIDILVGTQMIAKGLDFPKLKLVGLVLADVGFNLPDFRATERSYQLITQMSGRSGRHIKEGENPGYVIIQTYNKEHDSIRFAQVNDFQAFAENELQMRTMLNYPPIGKLASFRIQGPDKEKAEDAARLLSRRAASLKEQHNQIYGNVELLGPAEAALARLRNQFRYHFLVKASDSRVMNTFCRTILGDEDWIPAGVRISVDVDPMNLL